MRTGGQRKGDEGFGEGNFKALFESIERDQIQRGVDRSISDGMDGCGTSEPPGGDHEVEVMVFA